MPFLHPIFEQNSLLSGFAGIYNPLDDLAAAIFPNTVDRKGLRTLHAEVVKKTE
jgi:hypothetical protein